MAYSKSVLFEGHTQIASTAIIKDFSIIGKLFRPYLNGETEDRETTIINENTYIGFQSIIGNGSKIGRGTIVDDRSTIESNVTIGEETLIIYAARICSDSKVGDKCVIGGFIGEGTTIGNNCRIFGSIVHAQLNPQNGWDDEGSMEEGPVIHDNVFIGFNSVITAPVIIGPNSYICAGAIISKDVPSRHIARGKNEIVHFEKWTGKLKNSNIFK